MSKKIKGKIEKFASQNRYMMIVAMGKSDPKATEYAFEILSASKHEDAVNLLGDLWRSVDQQKYADALVRSLVTIGNTEAALLLLQIAPLNSEVGVKAMDSIHEFKGLDTDEIAEFAYLIGRNNYKTSERAIDFLAGVENMEGRIKMIASLNPDCRPHAVKALLNIKTDAATKAAAHVVGYSENPATEVLPELVKINTPESAKLMGAILHERKKYIPAGLELLASMRSETAVDVLASFASYPQYVYPVFKLLLAINTLQASNCLADIVEKNPQYGQYAALDRVRLKALFNEKADTAQDAKKLDPSIARIVKAVFEAEFLATVFKEAKKEDVSSFRNIFLAAADAVPSLINKTTMERAFKSIDAAVELQRQADAILLLADSDCQATFWPKPA